MGDFEEKFDGESKTDRINPRDLVLEITVPQSSAVAIADQWGFELFDVMNDGNCLFSAILHQLNLNCDVFPTNYQSLNALSLRRLAHAHITENIDLYGPFIQSNARYEESIPTNYINKYLADLATPGAWGDQLAFTALAAELKFSIAVLSDTNSAPIIIKSPIIDAPNIYIIHTDGYTHFQSLRIKNIPVIHEGIDAIIAGTEENALIPATILIADTLRIFEEYEMTADDISSDSDDESVFDYDREFFAKSYPFLEKIADYPNTPFREVEDFILVHNISEVEVLMMHRNWEACVPLLVEEPSRITEEDNNFHTLFYRTALVGSHESIESLIFFSYFKMLDSESKAKCLLDAAKGSLDQGGHLRECKKPIASMEAYLFGIAYGATALKLQPYDDYRRLLDRIHCQLCEVYYKYLNDVNSKKKVSIIDVPAEMTEIEIIQKILSVYEKFDDFVPHFLIDLRNQLNQLEFENQKTPPQSPESPVKSKFFKRKPSGDDVADESIKPKVQRVLSYRPS